MIPTNRSSRREKPDKEDKAGRCGVLPRIFWPDAAEVEASLVTAAADGSGAQLSNSWRLQPASPPPRITAFPAAQLDKRVHLRPPSGAPVRSGWRRGGEGRGGAAGSAQVRSVCLLTILFKYFSRSNTADACLHDTTKFSFCQSNSLKLA